MSISVLLIIDIAVRQEPENDVKTFSSLPLSELTKKGHSRFRPLCSLVSNLSIQVSKRLSS